MKKQLVFWGAVLLLAAQSFGAFAAPIAPVACDFYILVNSCPLPPPSQVEVTGATSNTLDVSWTGVTGAARYRVTAKNLGTGVMEADVIVNAPTQSITLTGLSHNSRFEVGVSASACTTGTDFGDATYGYGTTTNIIIGDVVYEFPSGCQQCDDPVNAWTNCVTFGSYGDNYYPTFVGKLRNTDTSNSWSFGFAMIAVCQQVLMVKPIDGMVNGITLNTVNGMVIGTHQSLGPVFYLKGLSGSAGSCQFPNAQSAFQLINPLASSQTIRFNWHPFNPTEQCDVQYDGPVPAGCNALPGLIVPDDGGIHKTQPAKALKTPKVADIQVSPNPFDQSATVRYDVPEDSPVTLTLFNTMGRAVRILEQSDHAAGSYQYDLETGDLPPGLYYLTLQTATGRQVRTIVKHQ